MTDRKRSTPVAPGRGVRCAAALTIVLFCGACTTSSPLPGAPEASSPRAAVDALLAADRAFSAAAAGTDVVSGLAAMFAPEVAMPVPGGRFTANASEAIAALRGSPDNATARAEWTPVRGGISADGTHGYTWGYMVVRKADGTAQPLKYLSYWVRQSGGWRVVAYKRRPRAAGVVSLAPVEPSLPARMVAPSGDAAQTERFRASLDATERQFSDDAKVVGLGVAFERYGSADAILLGGPNDVTVVVGPEAIGRLVSDGRPAVPSTLVWWPDRTLVASSGDLGVTIGLIRDTAPGPGAAPPVYPFFTVWRRASAADPWRYVAE